MPHDDPCSPFAEILFFVGYFAACACYHAYCICLDKAGLLLLGTQSSLILYRLKQIIKYKSEYSVSSQAIFKHHLQEDKT